MIENEKRTKRTYRMHVGVGEWAKGWLSCASESGLLPLLLSHLRVRAAMAAQA